MKQLTLATAGFERYAKTTRRGGFLAGVGTVWRGGGAGGGGRGAPFYRKRGKAPPPVGVERMLRIYFLQQWFNLSDPAVEEALYDSSAMRRFVEIDLGREPVPGETTGGRFRIRGKCGAWSKSPSVASRCPARRRCAASVICSKRTIWASSCSTKC